MSGKHSPKPLDHVKQFETDVLMHLIQKTPAVTGILIDNKLLIKLQESEKLHNRVIQKQLQMSMIKKYLKKDISPKERQKIIDNLRLI